MQHICRKCEQPFESPHKKAKYCCRDCADKHRHTRIDRLCRNCGANLVTPGQIKLWYCCKECRNSDPNRIVIDGMVHTSCKQCGIAFTHPNWRTNDYCSQQCSEKCLINSEIITSYCEHCEEPFQHKSTHHRRFCSKDCWHNHAVGENNPTWNSAKIECANCHKSLVRQLHRLDMNDLQFCTQQCRADYYSLVIVGPEHHLWRGGVKHYRGPNWYRQRDKARERDGFRCQHCGKTEKQLGKKLHVHHIVPFREFGYIRGVNENYKTANAMSNLISLCQSCHMPAEHGLITFQLPLI